jgi:hypothetical protein
MAYHIDDGAVSLSELQQRIEATDLVPSRAPLLEDINARMRALERHGITTLAGLRHELKNARRLEALAEATGIDAQYLVLLKREVEGYFPKPFPLSEFDWLPAGEIRKLEQHGLRDSAALYEATYGAKKARAALAKTTGADPAVIEELAHLADLTRVQWLSPATARMVLAAGCDGAAGLAAADAGALCEALARANEGGRFFKGKLGLRDVKRLRRAAGYVP